MHDINEKIKEPLVLEDKYSEIRKEIDISNAIIKDTYKILPKLTYPAIVITEIVNEENFKFTDNLGEHVSNVGYQIDCYSRSLQGIEAKDIVTLMGNMVNNLVTGINYKLRRIGQPVLMTLQTDASILRYTLRFEGYINLDTNTIYSTTN